MRSRLGFVSETHTTFIEPLFTSDNIHCITYGDLQHLNLRDQCRRLEWLWDIVPWQREGCSQYQSLDCLIQTRYFSGHRNLCDKQIIYLYFCMINPLWERTVHSSQCVTCWLCIILSYPDGQGRSSCIRSSCLLEKDSIIERFPRYNWKIAFWHSLTLTLHYKLTYQP